MWRSRAPTGRSTSSRPSRDPVLLRQLPRRVARRHGRPHLPAERRVRAGDPALPRLAEPLELPVHCAPAGAGVRDAHDLQVRALAEIAGLTMSLAWAVAPTAHAGGGPYGRGPAVERRTTIVGRNMRRPLGVPAALRSRLSTAISTAALIIFSTGMRTVVSAGTVISANGMSSKPMTENSSGT